MGLSKEPFTFQCASLSDTNRADNGLYPCMSPVLVSSGGELVFSLVAGTMCFGFSVRIMLITH